MKNRIKLLYYFLSFLITKKNSEKSYLHVRKAYMEFYLWRWFDFICKINCFLRGKYKILESVGVLGKLNKETCEKISNQIDVNGYYVFDQLLNEDIVDKIYTFSLNKPINYLELKNNKTIDFSIFKKKYSENKNHSVRHQFLETKELLEFEPLKDLIFDGNFLHIANEYLKTKPILDIITLWWSRPLSVIPKDLQIPFKNSSAQMFHYDLDRLKFLKFFIYLTDVNNENGPHVYVKNSHKKPSFFIKSDGRYSDELINTKFSNNVLKLVGKKGTIIAVDTRGIHKGMELINGERLLFQIEFTNSLFGLNNLNQFDEKNIVNNRTEFEDTYKLFVNFEK